MIILLVNHLNVLQVIYAQYLFSFLTKQAATGFTLHSILMRLQNKASTNQSESFNVYTEYAVASVRCMSEHLGNHFSTENLMQGWKQHKYLILKNKTSKKFKTRNVLRIFNCNTMSQWTTLVFSVSHTTKKIYVSLNTINFIRSVKCWKALGQWWVLGSIVSCRRCYPAAKDDLH